MWKFKTNFSHFFSVEHDHDESTAALEKLENIDSETDNLDITFVKMADSRYARKWGVTKLPALVYFRKRFPSIYRGTLPTNKFNYFQLIISLIRWHNVRGGCAWLAAKKSLPSTWAESLHVRTNCHRNRLCALHSFPPSVL